MAKKPIVNIAYPIYSYDELDEIMNLKKALGFETGEELLGAAIKEYVENHKK